MTSNHDYAAIAQTTSHYSTMPIAELWSLEKADSLSTAARPELTQITSNKKQDDLSNSPLMTMKGSCPNRRDVELE